MRVDLFGSVLRDDFDATSDVDLLVTFEEGVWYPIGDLLKMDDEAKALFGRDVDVVERRLVEENPNWVRRHSILSTATKVYAAA